VLTGERYSNITKETEGVLVGEYGATPAPVNNELQNQVLDGRDPVTCRPADLLEPEFDKQHAELTRLSKEERFTLANEVDDTLTYALFPQVGLKFLKNRNNPDAFEPAPGTEPEPVPVANTAVNGDSGVYTVEVSGTSYVVRVTEGGDVAQLSESSPAPVTHAAPAKTSVGDAKPVPAPLAGNVFDVLVNPGQTVSEGDVILILEAMKMETEIRSPVTGSIAEVLVKTGDAVKVGDALITVG
jgi:oxaloacetate decarboxylase alpha subunit